MNIFAIADIHGAIEPIQHAWNMIRKADLVVIAGDLSRKGSADEAHAVLGEIEQHNRRIVAVHGNWDGKDVQDILQRKGYSIHNSGRVINGIGFFGIGGALSSILKTHTHYSEEELSEYIANGYSSVKGAGIKILISHMPPRGLRDRTLFGIHAGSHSVRAFIDANKVDLAIVGHIHEAAGVENHNGSITANAGSFRKGKYLSIQINSRIRINAERLKM